MPDKSQAQWKKMFALEGRGEIKPGTAEEFARSTPGGFKALPKKVKKRRRVVP